MKAASPTYRMVFRAARCAVALGALACSSSDEAPSSALDAGNDAQNAATGGTAGIGGATAAGGRAPSTGGASTRSGGTSGNTGGRTASGGASSGGASSGGRAADAGSTGGSQQDPACASADGNGFFSDCSACTDPSNCDGVDTGGGVRRTCGCSGSGDCPCGFSCGCFTLAPGVRTCGICTR
jgi:hypothetical protein